MLFVELPPVLVLVIPAFREVEALWLAMLLVSKRAKVGVTKAGMATTAAATRANAASVVIVATMFLVIAKVR
jgi:hypothetical protein